jgi:hypothetical protein
MCEKAEFIRSYPPKSYVRGYIYGKNLLIDGISKISKGQSKNRNVH